MGETNRKKRRSTSTGELMVLAVAAFLVTKLHLGGIPTFLLILAAAGMLHFVWANFAGESDD